MSSTEKNLAREHMLKTDQSCEEYNRDEASGLTKKYCDSRKGESEEDEDEDVEQGDDGEEDDDDDDGEDSLFDYLTCSFCGSETLLKEATQAVERPKCTSCGKFFRMTKSGYQLGDGFLVSNKEIEYQSDKDDEEPEYIFSSDSSDEDSGSSEDDSDDEEHFVVRPRLGRSCTKSNISKRITFESSDGLDSEFEDEESSDADSINHEEEDPEYLPRNVKRQRTQ